MAILHTSVVPNTLRVLGLTWSTCSYRSIMHFRGGRKGNSHKMLAVLLQEQESAFRQLLKFCSTVQDLLIWGDYYSYQGAKFSQKLIPEKVLCSYVLPLDWYYILSSTEAAPFQGCLFLPVCALNTHCQASRLSWLVQQIETSSVFKKLWSAHSS